MKKKRSDSVIDGLPEGQRKQIEQWLCEENLSYADAQKRALADLGVRLSSSSLAEFFQECQQRRMLDRIAASRESANAVLKKFQENPADMYAVLVNIIGQSAFEASMKGEKLDPKLVFNFTKLVMHAKKQSMEEADLKLQREKFEFDAAAACLKKLPSLKVIAQKTGLDQKEKINQIRLQLFGAAPE